MAGRVKGKTIVVTGGASGLGFAISRLLASQEAAIAIVDIDGSRADEAARQLVGQGARSVGLEADVADWNAISEAISRVEATLGQIDGLVNNAGIAALGSVHEADEQSFRRVMEINVNGVFLASKAVLPGMLGRRRGAIVNIASIAGLVGVHNMAAYCASKGAIVSLTRQMAVDYAISGIRVNAIAPGMIGSTDMGRRLLEGDLTPQAQARRLSKYPMGRYAAAEEIAQAALFMLSDDSSFATGSILTVDGGMTAL